MTLFCLQMTWKVMHAKNFAALLHKLNMRCLVNLYDVQKGRLFETTFLIRFIFGSIVNLVYFLHFVQTK